MTRKLTLTFLTVVFCLASSVAWSETVNSDDLVEREGVYYKKFTDVPFTGEITGEENGKLKNGKKEGPWLTYHKSGLLSFKGTYKNGKLEGPWVSYYDDYDGLYRWGQIWIKGTSKNGKSEGPSIMYWQNGDLYTTGIYKNGKKEGFWVAYDMDGTLINALTAFYKNGKKIK